MTSTRKNRLLTFVLIAAAMIMEACGGGTMNQIGNLIGGGAQTAKHIFAGRHAGSIALPGNASAKPLEAAMLFQATAPAAAQIQQSYDAQCDFSGNAGFLGSVPDGAFVPLGLPGVPNALACTTFSTPARIGIGKRTITDGTASALVVQITTTTGQSIVCKDLTTQAALADATALQFALVPNGGTVTVAVLVTTANGTSIAPLPFTCPLTVAPSAVQSVEVNLAKI